MSGRARRLPRSRFPNTPARLRAVDPRSPAHQAGEPDAGARPHARRGREARRLPGEAQIAAARPRSDAGATRADLGAAPGRARLADDDRPQADRASLLLDDARLLRCGRHRSATAAHAARAAEQHGARTEPLRPALHDARPHDDLLVHHPDDDGCVRQLPDPADARRARHGIPALECAELLDLPRLGTLRLRGPPPRLRAERGLVRLRPARVTALRPRQKHRVLRARADLQLDRVDLTAANFIVTIFKYRAPGMSFNRIPLFCFAFLAASFGLLFALPVAQRRPRLSSSSTATSARISSTPPTEARRSSGSTCSGSSAIRRSTS